MKIFARLFIGVLVMMGGSVDMKAQDVYISVPVTNIFNRAEFTTIKTVMQANGTTWNGFLGLIAPTFRSVSGENFSTLSGILLPTSILHWRLESMGGDKPPFYFSDTWPGYKWFTNNNQTWYQPIGFSTYSRGNINFTFKIPSNEFTIHAYHAGEYSLEVTHNYNTSYFSPKSFETILSIPAAISWRTTNPTKNITISSLNAYRLTSDYQLGDLGNATIGNTVDFNLHAKASSTNIAFTSTKTVQETRNISTIQLGSTGTGLTKKALSANWQNYSIPSFVVKTGNRNNFTLQFSVSANNFKNYFFEAGTYSFQLNLDARSTDNTISDLQNTDVTIKVLPLSEITIPTSRQSVNFNFNTSAHYRDGLSKVMPNQIKLSNNETFELYVKSRTNYFKKGGIQTDVNSNILQIGIDGSSSVSLSTTPQKIILSGTPVLDQELNIKYTIPPTGAQSLTGKEATTYSIDVIYSFTAL